MSHFRPSIRTAAGPLRENPNRFHALQRALAAACILLASIAGCVLPPPPLEEKDAAVVVPLAIDLDKVEPVAAEVQLQRNPTSQQKFSVFQAVNGLENPKLKYYWFVNYDPVNPTKWDFEGDPQVLDGCKNVLNEVGQDVYTLEVLVTEGVLRIELTGEGDNRFSSGGEPIVSHRWTLRVKGIAGEECNSVPTGRR